MFAYGVPRRTVLLQGIAEGGIVGALASVVGLGLGLLVVSWIVRSIVPETFPELEIDVVVTPTTLAAAAVIGVVACALTPLLTARRLRRMDIASTLRVME
jgi:putative ABC transport system permease protein